MERGIEKSKYWNRRKISNQTAPQQPASGARAERKYNYKGQCMTAKEYLSQLAVLNRRINNLISECEHYIHDAAGIRAIVYDADKVQFSPSGDKMLEIIARYEEKKEEICKRIKAYDGVRGIIVSEINQLEDHRYVQMLYLRYVEGKRLEEISCIMKRSDGSPYSYEYIRRMHGYALDAFTRMHGENFKKFL